MGRLDDKVAVISGGARGLGAATARRFVAEGARVVIADLLEMEGRALAAELGARARYESLDVTQAADWNAVVSAAAEYFGPVTVLVNAAGIVKPAALTEHTDDDFRQVVEVNQFGVFYGMRAVVPSMRSVSGGSIVNVSSVGGMQGHANIISYVASKWAVRGMTKAAALELASSGIRVNSVHPGVFRSPMSAGMDEAAAAAMVPLGRIGEASEIAAMITYLASDDASFSTGTEHVVDGGLLAGELATDG